MAETGPWEADTNLLARAHVKTEKHMAGPPPAMEETRTGSYAYLDRLSASNDRGLHHRPGINRFHWSGAPPAVAETGPWEAKLLWSNQPRLTLPLTTWIHHLPHTTPPPLLAWPGPAGWAHLGQGA